MIVEKIERVYLSPVSEREAINALMSDKEFTLTTESSTCFIFEKRSKNNFTVLALKGGDKE